MFIWHFHIPAGVPLKLLWKSSPHQSLDKICKNISNSHNHEENDDFYYKTERRNMKHRSRPLMSKNGPITMFSSFCVLATRNIKALFSCYDGMTKSMICWQIGSAFLVPVSKNTQITAANSWLTLTFWKDYPISMKMCTLCTVTWRWKNVPKFLKMSGVYLVSYFTLNYINDPNPNSLGIFWIAILTIFEGQN